VHASTNADLEGLKVGDVITMIDDEFVCGVPLKEGLEMLSGPMDTTVSMMVNRVQGRIKTRLPFEIVRDFDLKPMDSEKEARKKDRKATALAERSFAPNAVLSHDAVFLCIRKTPCCTDYAQLTFAIHSERLEAEAAAHHERMLAEAKVQAAARQEEASKKDLANLMSSKKSGMAPRSVEPPRRTAPPVQKAKSTDMSREVPILDFPSLEDPKRKKKVYDLKAGGADVGIKYSPHARGLVVSGFIKGSEAANSGLMVGDLIFQVEESFLAGLPALESYNLMSGDMGSIVELTVTRQVKGVKKRLEIDVMRDLPSPPKKADLGIDFKLEAAGLRVTKVHEGTSAFVELQKGDLITEIDEEFIAGLPLSEAKELLSGPARSEICLGFTRLDAVKSIKRRCSADLIFDYKPRPAPLAEYSSMGDVGIEYATDAMGLKVTGFTKLSSAASSGLQLGDIITQVDDELIIGLPGYLVTLF